MSIYDLLVVGGGTAGLTAAVGAAGVGARVMLVEERRTGGDCLWTGCVPSKALIAASRRAHDMRTADDLGLSSADPVVSLPRIMRRVHDVIATIEPHDSPERLRSLGVEVAETRATFVAPGLADVGGRKVRWRTALIATGSSPSLPPVDGIDRVDALTTDTLWDLDELPPRLVVLGGGAIGSELGQAFARLGSVVTIVEMADRLLPTAIPDAGHLLADRLRLEGIDVRTSTRALAAEPGCLEVVDDSGATSRIPFDRLLVATGRGPRTAGLELERLGVETDPGGYVVVDDTLRTSARNVFAAGDVTGWMPFTHVAGAHGGLVVTNALFKLRRRFRPELVPWTIFTDPEIAHVGIDAAEARSRWGGEAIVTRQALREVDRAITEGRTVGFAELVADPKGRIVGATIVGDAAGESIAEVTAWISTGGKLRNLGAAVHAYPTMSEGVWWAALEHLRGQYLSPRTRQIAAGPLWLLRHLDVPRDGR